MGAAIRPQPHGRRNGHSCAMHIPVTRWITCRGKSVCCEVGMIRANTIVPRPLSLNSPYSPCPDDVGKTSGPDCNCMWRSLEWSVSCVCLSCLPTIAHARARWARR